MRARKLTAVLTCIAAALAAMPVCASAADTDELTAYYSSFELGDVNCDGFVDATDATDVLRFYADISTGVEPSDEDWIRFRTLGNLDADVHTTSDGVYDGSQFIDAADAQAILVKYMNYSTDTDE